MNKNKIVRTIQYMYGTTNIELILNRYEDNNVLIYEVEGNKLLLVEHNKDNNKWIYKRIGK